MTILAFLQHMSIWQVLLLLGVILLFFGKRLPEVGKSLGKGIVEFKKGLKEGEESADEKREELPPATRTTDREPAPRITQRAQD